MFSEDNLLTATNANTHMNSHAYTRAHAQTETGVLMQGCEPRWNNEGERQQEHRRIAFKSATP